MRQTLRENAMTFFQEVYDRVRFATNTKTQAELANILEIRQSSISDAKRRDSVPPEWYIKLFEKFGLNPDWIKQGVGPMYLRTEQGYIPRELPLTGVQETPMHYGDPISKSVLHTVFSMRCNYIENSNSLPILQPTGKIALPQPYTGANILVFQTESDAFLPLVRRYTYLGINTDFTHPQSGEIYAVFMPYEGIALKRLFLSTQKNGFCLCTDQNDSHESFLPAQECPIRILGRLAWVIQTF